MPLVDSVVPAVAKRLPKVISPAAHGLIDFAYAAFFLGVAVTCRKRNKPAAVAALGVGTLVITQSLLTNYTWGVTPFISFETHGKLDAALASASWAIPGALGFANTPAAKIFTASSLVSAAVVGLTDFNSDLARQEKIAG